MGKILLKILGGFTIFLLLIVAITWLFWIPSASGPGYVFVKAWGEKGSAPGQFNDPIGLAVYKDEVFASDSRNGRIQVFDFDGKFKRQISSKGDGLDQLGRPMNLTIAGNELYVADYMNDRIQVFGLDGTYKRRAKGRASSVHRVAWQSPLMATFLSPIFMVSGFSNSVLTVVSSGNGAKLAKLVSWPVSLTTLPMWPWQQTAPCSRPTVIMTGSRFLGPMDNSCVNGAGHGQSISSGLSMAGLPR